MRYALAVFALLQTLAAAPVITSAGSCPIDVNASDQMLTVAGSGFVPGSVVKWTGTPLATDLLGTTLLTSTVPASLLTASGKFAITVTNPDGSVSNSYGCVVQPVLDRVDPGIVVLGESGVTLTATGRGFRASSALAIDFPAGRTILATTIASSTSLTASVPASSLTAAGTFNIYVYDTADDFSSRPMGFLVMGPQIVALSPASVTAGGAPFSLGVSGTGFSPTSIVRWNGTPLTTTYGASNGLGAAVPANLIATPGTASITVATGSVVSNPATLTIAAGAVPYLYSLTPSSVMAGSGSFVLTVVGDGFLPGAVMRWNSTGLDTTFVNSTVLSATVPADLITLPGGATISVANPGGGASGNKSISITPVKPTISSANPPSVAAGTASLSLTLTGTGFVAGQTSVEWNGTGVAVSVASSTQLTATITGDRLVSPGTVSITVSILGVYSAPYSYTVTPGRPLIGALLPSSATAGGPAFSLTVFGDHFVPESIAKWNGSALTTTYISATELSAAVSASLIAAPGVGGITVANPGGLVSDNTNLLINAGRAALLSLTPQSAVSGGPAFTLAVFGSGFLPTSKVLWNGTQLDTTYIRATDLTASVPASLIAAPGTIQVSIANPGAADSIGMNFKIDTAPIPVVSSVSPVPSAGGPASTLTIAGSGFASAAVASWNGTALATTFVSSGELKVVVPAALIAKPGTCLLTVAQQGVTSDAFPISILSATPVISSLDPASVTAGGPSFTLRVTGTGFGAGSAVLFNGQALTTSLIGPAELSASVRAELIAAPRSVAIAVDNFGTVSASTTLTIAAPVPAITTLSPASAVAGGAAFTLSVSGTAFLSGATVEWNGTAIPTVFVSSSSLQAQVAASLIATAGSASVDVLNPGGTRSSAASFTITPADRAISLSPVSAIAGGPTFTMTVTGTGFTASSTIRWNGTALPTTFVDAAQLQGSVSASLIANPATVAVTVADAGAAASTPATFTVSPATPRITALVPNTATAGSPGFVLTVSGADFAADSSVRWNGTALTTNFVDGTHLTADIPAALIANKASVQVTVGTGPVSSLPATFAITPPSPVVSSITPATAVAGSPDITLTVFGSYFVSDSIVQWNGTPLQTSFVTPVQLSAVVPAHLLAAPGTATVSLATASPAPSSVAFTITAGRPVISSLSPATATAGGPSFTLTVNGSGFGSGSVVEWNHTPLTTTYGSATRLTANVPAALIASPDNVAITVVDAAGATSLAVSFAIVPLVPAISGLSPDTVTAGGPDFELKVSGSGFVAASTVLWNDTPLATVFVRDSQLSATVPQALISAPTSAQIAVRNSADSTSLPALLTVGARSLTIGALEPSSATAGGPAFTLTVNGSGFVQGASVLWNGASLPATFVDSTRLRAQVASTLIGAAGEVPITVSIPSGGSATPVTFRINPANAAISALRPDRMTAGAPAFRLTVDGTGFLPSSVVLWNDTPLPVTYVSPTQVTADVAGELIASPGTVSITARSLAGQPTSAPAAFTVEPLTIGALDPSSANVGSAAISIRVAGSGFLSGATVYWKDQALATTFIDSGSLLANVPANLLAAEGTAPISVSNPGGTLSAGQVFTIVAVRPVVSIGAIANSASGGTVIAPGALFSIYGTGLANGIGYGNTNPLPSEINGTAVTINGVAIPLMYTSPEQINAQVPFEIPAGTATVVVRTNGVSSDPAQVEVRPRAPGIFTSGGNHALAFKASDWSVNSAGNPASPGEYLVLYLTGQGSVDGASTGASAPVTPATLPLNVVQVTIGGKPTTVTFAGLVPGFVGLCQVNLIVPAAAPGEQSLEITMDGAAVNPTVVYVGGN
jgi:uncharacterized protein (TIGR03437 family)